MSKTLKAGDVVECPCCGGSHVLRDVPTDRDYPGHLVHDCPESLAGVFYGDPT